MNLPLLKELVESHGIAGWESAPREIVRRELAALGEPTVDRVGNLHLVLPGKENAPKVMVAAHTDEIGFLVRYVDDEGFVFLQPLGGFDPRQMNSKRVRVQTDAEALPGTLNYGTKPKHLLSDEEAKAGQKIESFFVDLGLGKAASERVRPGDRVTMDAPLVEVGDLLAGKAMDDRAGVYVMIEALKRLSDHDAEIHAVATVQEEIGLRGAAAAGSAIAPDIAIALDVTLANDIPGVPKLEWCTELGKGAAIKIMDSSLVCDPDLVRRFREIAEREGIPHQMEILARGGTDAGAIQRLHGGIPSFTLSLPCRYVHTTNETVHRDDLEACVSLLAAFLSDPRARAFVPAGRVVDE